MENLAESKGITKVCSTCKHIIISGGFFLGIGKFKIQCPNSECPTFKSRVKQKIIVGQKFFLTVTIFFIFLLCFQFFNKIYANKYVTCNSFVDQEAAQEFFNSNPTKYQNLDKDNDLKACEYLP